MEDFRCECMNEWIDNRPQFVIGGRQSGKTLLLIKEASRTNGIIVCPSRNMVENIFQMASEIGYPILRPITYDQLFTYPNWVKKNAHYFDEYGITLLNAFRKQLSVFERHNTKSIIIDEESIESLNDVLAGLKVVNMSGRELRFKIEVLGRNESDD